MKKAYFSQHLVLSVLDEIRENSLVLLPRKWAIRQLKERLIRENGVLFDLDIYTFDDLILPAKNEILKNRKIITKDQEVLIVYNLLKDIFKNNSEYEHVLSCEFIRQVLYVLNIMFLESKDYKILIEKDNERYGWLKKLYVRYKEYLDENNLVNYSYLQDLAICLYENGKMKLKDYECAQIAFFVDYRIDQQRLLKLMARDIPVIKVNMPYWDDVKLCKDNAQFLRSLGFEIIFDEIKGTRSKDHYVFSCPNVMLEIKNLIKNIKKDYKENGLGFGSFAIVTPSIERYKDILVRSFSEELLPVNLLHQKNLLEFGFIKFVVDLIEFLGAEFNKQSFFKIISNKLLNRENADFEALFKKMREVYISDIEDIQQIIDEMEFEANLNFEYEKIENIKKIQTVFNRLLRAKGLFDLGKKPYQKWLEQTKEVFKRLGIVKTGEFVNDIEFIKAFYALSEIIDKGIEDLNYDFVYSYEEFLDIFKMVLSQKMIDVSISILDGIDILTPQDVLGLEYEKVYFIGLCDDLYPKAPNEGFLMNQILKNELGISEIKDFEYQFQKDLVYFRTILNSYKTYMSFSRFNKVESNPSPFLQIEDVKCVYIEKSYLPDKSMITYQDYKLMKNINSLKDLTSSHHITIEVPKIKELTDRHLAFIFTCPLRFLFKKFNVDQEEKEETFFSANLRLLFLTIKLMLSNLSSEDIYKSLYENIKYTNSHTIKMLAAEDIYNRAFNIAQKMKEFGIDHFEPRDMLDGTPQINTEVNGVLLRLYPDFTVKANYNEIVGFVKKDRTERKNAIDKIWISRYIFNQSQIAVIYLEDSIKFEILNFEDDMISAQDEENIRLLNEFLCDIENIERYKKTIDVSKCFMCDYNHVCILF